MAGSGEAGSGEAEAAAADLVEVLEPETATPVALVVLGGEVAGTEAGAERLKDRGGVLLVARAPGGGRDVHDVAPALLVLDGRDAVHHVAVPPDRIAGLDVGDAGERAGQQPLP